METAFKWGRKMKNSPSCAHVLLKSLEFGLFTLFFSGDGKENYKNKPTRTVIVFVFVN